MTLRRPTFCQNLRWSLKLTFSRAFLRLYVSRCNVTFTDFISDFILNNFIQIMRYTLVEIGNEISDLTL
jgi:hypothetical protein